MLDFVRKLSWIPGLGFLDTELNQLSGQKTMIDQQIGAYRNRLDMLKSVGDDVAGQAAETVGMEGAEVPEIPDELTERMPDMAEGARDKLGAFAKPRRRRRGSPATRASCLTALFLVVLVATVWLVFLLDPQHVPWRHAMSWPRIAAEVALVLIIPFTVYRGLRMWLEGERSDDPDLDYAWQAGVDALEANGMSLLSAPIFLILGSSGEQQERAILQATGLDLRVAGVPRGPAPLHWYANPQGIYLFCTEVGWLSALAALRETRAREARASSLRSASGEPSDTYVAPSEYIVTRTEAAAPAMPDPTSIIPSEPITGTVMLDQFITAGSASRGGSTAASSDRSLSAGYATIQGTATPMAAYPEAQAASRPPAALGYSPELTADGEPITLNSQESTQQLRRLQQVCQRLRLARQPVCPINGLLVLLPFQGLASSAPDVDELQRAVKGDLHTVHQRLKLRCPVTSLVVGMEHERGFCELIRRVGRSRAMNQRFGRKFDVRAETTSTELRGFNAHVCGAFEDWVYTLFREEQSLTRPGNTQLYGLLCKVRCSLKTRLSDLLVGSFAHDQPHSPYEQPLLFSGCYFAATGPTADRQAFVRGVFEKLVDEQEYLEWTKSALAEDRRNQVLGITGAVAAVATLGALAYLLGSDLLR